MYFWLSEFSLTAKRLWSEASTAQRAGYASGVILILLGIMHIPVHLFAGTAWEETVSWRKPILFGISTGLTLLSIAWVGSLCKHTSPITVSAFSLAALIEVALITLQTWRGEASHYNYSSVLNESIQHIIEGCALLLTLGILIYTWKLFISAITDRPLVLLSARAGMVYLLAACFFGIWMVIYGAERVASNQPPELYGDAGVLKFVHGLPIHAIQLFPFYVWMATRRGVSFRWMHRGVWLLIVGVGLITAYGSMQTFQGLARFDWTWISLPVLVGSGICFVIPFALLIQKDPAESHPTGPLS